MAAEADVRRDRCGDAGQEQRQVMARVDEHAGVPHRDHLLQWMHISVSEPEKRTGNSSVKQDTYVVYLIECKVTDPEMPFYGEPPTSVWRRYSEFELLRSYLEIMYPAIVVPPLPEKRVSHAWQKLPTDRLDIDFIERRRVGLENFLLRVASHSILSRDSLFRGFLKDDNVAWRDALYATDFQSKGECGVLQLENARSTKHGSVRFSIFYQRQISSSVPVQN